MTTIDLEAAETAVRTAAEFLAGIEHRDIPSDPARDIRSDLQRLADELRDAQSARATPLADLQWCREELMRAARDSSGKELLEVVKELRQVLKQIDAMEKTSGTRAASAASAGKLDAALAAAGDDWDG